LTHALRESYDTHTMQKTSLMLLPTLLFCVLPLVGCWTTKDQVFSASEGDPVPEAVHLEQLMATNDGKPLHVSKTGNNNDFVFSIDGHMDVACYSARGTFRAIHMRDDIYLLQIACDGNDEYDLQFYRISKASYHTVKPIQKNDADVAARLARFKVKSSDDGALSGALSDINAYIHSFKDDNFEESKD
jgi:hypothetical protein